MVETVVDVTIGSMWIALGIGLIALLAYKMSRIEREMIQSKHVLHQNLSELEGANSKLQDVGDLKERVLAQVSHELRTPLAAICTAAQAVKRSKEPAPDTVKGFIDAIIRESHRLSGMVDNLLGLVDTESGPTSNDTPQVATGKVITGNSNDQYKSVSESHTTSNGHLLG